jgi:hypothetical protein
MFVIMLVTLGLNSHLTFIQIWSQKISGRWLYCHAIGLALNPFGSNIFFLYAFFFVCILLWIFVHNNWKIWLIDICKTIILQNINFIIFKHNVLKCKVIEAADNEDDNSFFSERFKVKFRQQIFKGKGTIWK